MKLPSIPYLASAFLAVFRRFPMVMISAIIGVGFVMFLIENGDSVHEKDFIRVVMTASLGLSVFLCAAVVAEKYQLRMPMMLVPNILALGLVLVYFYSLSFDEFKTALTPVRFVGLSLAAHLGVAFLPYLDRSPVEDFWEYNKQLFGNFMVGAFYSLVIFAGLGIAILAVNELFNLRIDEKIYAHLFVLVAGIFNTAYFLANFPKQFEFISEVPDNQAIATPTSPYTTSFKNLTKFILIPIATIYFLILYAFSAKILVQWELPQGWVGKLVLGFSVAGIFTYLLNFMLAKYDESQIVKGFRRWFFYVLLPMVVLLFVAIGRRISDYGVTEARYVVATAGVWLLLMSLYFIIAKRDNIKFIPISLAFFSLLTVLGPFSAFKVSERNQAGRLMAILVKNKMLKDGKAIPASDSLSKHDADNISGAITYLGENNKFSKVAPLFGMPDSTNQLSWEQRDSLMNFLGVTKLNWATGTCYINFVNNSQNTGLNIKGYERFYNAHLYEPSSKSSDPFSLAPSRKALVFISEGMKNDSFDLRPFIEKVKVSDACGKDYNEIGKDSLANYVINTANYEVKLMTENSQFRKLEKGWEIESWDGMILLRKKQ
ncbi:MAG: DUF4153 domain-containing protein [Saprospiraceae bacterium]|nr:DUF4153 domain-containing protein [Saprospiraceae bacterium]MCF8250409.1 DUF4153 domain-containing protein [Saprospiraceae bacterium]MCF8280671.1 DUF4153 domain-containing protein [Bacteroidales bacterium]MCF8312216.1 DUF4153 domain-containing protein [Saprospiraceae bacterium]MCF8440557.1 DUF4153 domain-containing protein [Saprospiraceae bacterium]